MLCKIRRGFEKRPSRNLIKLLCFHFKGDCGRHGFKIDEAEHFPADHEHQVTLPLDFLLDVFETATDVFNSLYAHLFWFERLVSTHCIKVYYS